jgi:cytokinesis protein
MKSNHAKQNEAGQSGAILTESPEWYIKRFLDKTVTAKQAEACSSPFAARS